MNDHHFRALANERRRDLLRRLQRHPHLHLDIQAEPADRAVSLVHVDLPMLDDAGLIEWDPDSNAITRGEDFDELAPIRDYLAAMPVEGSD